MHSLEMKRSIQEIKNTEKQFIPSQILTNLRQSKKRTTSYLLVLPQFRSDWGISLEEIQSESRIFEWVNLNTFDRLEIGLKFRAYFAKDIAESLLQFSPHAPGAPNACLSGNCKYLTDENRTEASSNDTISIENDERGIGKNRAGFDRPS